MCPPHSTRPRNHQAVFGQWGSAWGQQESPVLRHWNCPAPSYPAPNTQCHRLLIFYPFSLVGRLMYCAINKSIPRLPPSEFRRVYVIPAVASFERDVMTSLTCHNTEIPLPNTVFQPLARLRWHLQHHLLPQHQLSPNAGTSHLQLPWQSPSLWVPISRHPVGIRGRGMSSSSCSDLLTSHLPTMGTKTSGSPHFFLVPHAFFLVSSHTHSLCPSLPFHFFSFYLTPWASEGANISLPSEEKRFYDWRWSNRTKVCSKWAGPQWTGTRKQPSLKELNTQLDPMFSWRVMVIENYSKKCFPLLELLGFARSLLMSDCSCVSFWPSREKQAMPAD